MFKFLTILLVSAGIGHLAHADDYGQCPAGYVWDPRASTCHDPCGTWFTQPNPACSRGENALEHLKPVSSSPASTQNGPKVKNNDPLSIQNPTSDKINFGYVAHYDDFKGEDVFTYAGDFSHDALAVKIRNRIASSSHFQKGDINAWEGEPQEEMSYWYHSGELIQTYPNDKLNLIAVVDDAKNILITRNYATITGGRTVQILDQLLRENIPASGPVQITAAQATLFANDGSAGDSFLSCSHGSTGDTTCEISLQVSQ